MTTVYFYGSLEKYGKSFEVEASTIKKAVNIIAVQIAGLKKELFEGKWKISRGKEFISEDGLGLNPGDEVHVYPSMHGAASGVTQVIVGAILISIGVFAPVDHATKTYLISSGITMMVGGAISMFTKIPGSDYGKKEKADQAPSFLFNGATNTSTQGLPVPVVLGECVVGSVIVSAGLSVVNLSNAEYEEIING